ncbi:MAG: Rpn family recombination-promoting nuclease/putative transposase [Cellulosilyticaceae bacterium]
MPYAINPFTDFGFKKLFGEASSKDILIDFLNAILQKPNPIVDIVFQNTEKYGEYFFDRKAIFDIYCTDSEGAHFIVEMQNAGQRYFKDRTIFYSTFPIREQAKKGTWNFKLEPIYCIGLLGFDMEQNDERYYYEVQLKDQYNDVFYDKLTFIYIELPKFHLKESELKTNVDRWLYFLKHIEDFNELPYILNEPVFQHAFEKAKDANLTPEERAEYEKSLKIYRDNINVIDYARTEGKEEGRKEGLAEGLAEGRQEGRTLGIAEGLAEGKKQALYDVAKNLLDLLDDETIALKTGLSLAEISNLRN